SRKRRAFFGGAIRRRPRANGHGEEGNGGSAVEGKAGLSDEAVNRRDAAAHVVSLGPGIAILPLVILRAAADEHPGLSLRGRRADRGNPSGLLRRCAPRNDKREVHRPEPSKTLVLVSSLRMTKRECAADRVAEIRHVNARSSATITSWHRHEIQLEK